MNAPPPVSIGLPVYNGEAYLAQTLRDWLGQTFADFELIVCDNASTDATPDLLADAARRDPRVVVHRNTENVGALANANLAFERSRGPRYVLSAYDDRHASDFLARLVPALDADPGAVVAYGRKTLIGADDAPFAWHPDARLYTDADGATYDYDSRLERPMPDGRIARFRAVLRANDINATIHGLFRRDALERAGHHYVHGSDRLIVAHTALLGRFAFVDAPLFGYRIHPASTFHLTRAAWMLREAGRAGAASALDGLHTLRRYAAATGRADLPLPDRLAALVAVGGYAVRPHVLRNAFLPGPDNFWGWTHWPGQSPPMPRAPRGATAPAAEWAWLAAPDPASTAMHEEGASEEGRSGNRRREVSRSPAAHSPFRMPS